MNLSKLGETEQEARLLPFRYLIPLQIPELFSQLSRHAFGVPFWLPQDCLEGYPLQQLLLFPGTSSLKLEPDLLSSPYFYLFPCLSEAFFTPEPRVFFQIHLPITWFLSRLWKRKHSLPQKKVPPSVQTSTQTSVQLRTCLNHSEYLNSKLLFWST